jgi:AraC-like DNA-binding protein
LCRARESLCQPDRDTTVTGVAFRFGFWHLSRFAAAYSSTFGELPSATLRNALGSPPDERLARSEDRWRAAVRGGTADETKLEPGS